MPDNQKPILFNVISLGQVFIKPGKISIPLMINPALEFNAFSHRIPFIQYCEGIATWKNCPFKSFCKSGKDQIPWQRMSCEYCEVPKKNLYLDPGIIKWIQSFNNGYSFEKAIKENRIRIDKNKSTTPVCSITIGKEGNIETIEPDPAWPEIQPALTVKKNEVVELELPVNLTFEVQGQEELSPSIDESPNLISDAGGSMGIDVAVPETTEALINQYTLVDDNAKKTSPPSDRDFPPLAPSASKPLEETTAESETKTEKAKTWSRQPLYFMRIEGSNEEKIEIGRVSIKEAVNITRTRQEKEKCDVYLFKQNKYGEVFEISWKNYLSDKKPIYIQSASGQRRNKKISATQHGTPGIPYFFLEWPEGNEGPAQKTTAEAIDWAWEKAYYLENEVGVRLYKFRKSDSKKTEINWRKKKSALFKVRQENSPPSVDLIDDRKQEPELFAPASLPPVLNDEREVDIDLRPVIPVPAKKTEKTQFNFKLNLAPLQIRISGKFDFTVSLGRTED